MKISELNCFIRGDGCARVEWINFAKCIAISLVIIGHVLSWVHPQYKAVYVAIYSMHMPFFFMLSGLTTTSAVTTRSRILRS